MLTGCTDALFLLRLGGETAWTQYKLKVRAQSRFEKSFLLFRFHFFVFGCMLALSWLD